MYPIWQRIIVFAKKLLSVETQSKLGYTFKGYPNFTDIDFCIFERYLLIIADYYTVFFKYQPMIFIYERS
ncbi:hypothetical protein bsdcttw_12750 [Anaerocolumna chitinilytica]|uniref:Uncharacterized protein n=1 Tax=Anaerocolumna chitinilytica TaxID=1727145 RepID=A0A7I8DLQ3_9FIRM|nr:hypothetical protein bsdcttw_12750 [Anaerocolumna chitinilytica]